jgi:uncharacterized protein (TIGR03435 family)
MARISGILAILLLAGSSLAQPPPVAQKLEFEVASVRENKSDGSQPHSNVPLGPGDAFNSTDGLFRASNFPLIIYIAFAYRMTDAQLEAFRSAAPDWVLTTHFNIEARIEDPAATKDQIRLMMRSLLAERFHLATHEQARETNVFALILARPPATGPKLQPHTASDSCPRNYYAPKTSPKTSPESASPPKETVPAGYPTVCGSILGLPASALDRYSFGARDVPIRVLANSLTSWGHLGRPVLDQTGLTGNYDFVLDFTPDQPPPNAPDSGGPTFIEALQQQLGLKLKPQKGQVQFIILDHIDHLTQN